MLVNTSTLLNDAKAGSYSVGAFNVYTLEQALAVVRVAESAASPVILQILPSAMKIGGTALIKLCREAGRWTTVPVSVHLDHCSDEAVIHEALAGGMTSIMADGSGLPYDANVAFTRRMVDLAGRFDGVVEAELGRLTGTEDGHTIDAAQSQMTDPHQAGVFVQHTGVAALAVCIGNLHGRYTSEPQLDFDRLARIAREISVPLVLHGTSGLPDAMIRQATELGVCKFNVNTELRQAYLSAAARYFEEVEKPELVALMQVVIEAVQTPVIKKLELFGSIGRSTKKQ